MIKAVIFDMDGVLINSEPLHFACDISLLKEFGINVEPHFLEQFVGTTNPAMWKKIKQEYNIEKSVDEILLIQRAHKLRLLDEGNFTAIDGILELFDTLKKNKILIGVGSSSSRVFIQAVLKKLNIEDYIDAWESGEEVENSKPAPDIFLKVAELLGCSSKECMVIEDSKSGVAAAKAAGMKCIGFQNPLSGNQDLSKADIIVESFTEIDIEILI